MLACTEIIQIVEAREDLDQSADQPGYMAATLEKVCMVINQGLIPGGYSQKNLVGVCGPLPKTLTLFMNKICDFPYPIYDLANYLIPYL